MDWYPRYPAHYDRDTLHLTLAQHGAYCRLIDYYMTSEKPLPADDRALAAILRCSTEEWAQVRDAVRAFFTLKAGALHHKRCDAELEAQRRIQERNRENGKKGGRPKGVKNKEEKTGRLATANPDQTQKKPQTDRQTDLSDSSALSSNSDLLGETTLETVAAASGNSRFALPVSWTPSQPQREHARKLGLTDPEIDREAVKFTAFFTEGRGSDERRNLKEWRGSWHSWADKAAADKRKAEADDGPTDWSIYNKPADKAARA